MYASNSNLRRSEILLLENPPCVQRISRTAQAMICQRSFPWSLCVSKRYSFGWKSGSTVTLQVKQAQLNYNMTRGKNSIMSKAGLTVPCEYFMNIGRQVFSAKNAPCLKLRMQVPFVVPPSGNNKKGAYYPVCSIRSYLSRMAISALALLSYDPPLGI